MSARSAPTYGIREFDLSVDRSSEREYQLIQLPKARYISMISVPDECYLRFGSRTSPRLDLRDYSELEAEEGTFGTAYLENPAGSGTLRMLIGVTISSEKGDAVTISSINDSVDISDRAARDLGTVDVTDPVDVSSDAARSIGKARLMDSTETLVDPAADSTVQSVETAVSAVEADVQAVNDAQGPFSDITTGFDDVVQSGNSYALNGGGPLPVPAGSAVTVKAEPANTGDIYIGDSTVTASDGYVLGPDQSAEFAIDDVSKLYITAANGGEGVRWKVEN